MDNLISFLIAAFIVGAFLLYYLKQEKKKAGETHDFLSARPRGFGNSVLLCYCFPLNSNKGTLWPQQNSLS